MKIMLKIFALFAALYLFAACDGFASAADGLSFQKARSMLMERSDRLEAAAANTESRKETVNSQKTLLGPTVTAQIGQLWGETHIDIDRSVKTPLGAMPIRIDEHKDFNGPRAAATATWPLFTGGKLLAEQRAGKYALDEARAKERAVAVELDTRLAGLYFGLSLALAIEKVRADMLEQQKREVARAKKFEVQGMISKVDRLGVEVARDRGEREWLKARNAARIARIELSRLLRFDNIRDLSTPLFVLSGDLGSLNSWVEQALANNPQIAMFEAKSNQAEQGTKSAMGNWFPDIFGIGQYSFIRHYQTMVEPTWFAGIGLNLTIWDARGRLGAYRSARATLREAKAAKAEATNQVRADAEVAWQNTRDAMERYQLTAGNVALAKENLELKTRGFEEGLCAAIEMTEARTRLAEARVDRKVAAYEFVINYVILHAIAGKMDDFMNTLERKNLILEQ